MASSIVEKFYSMEYGPAPEDASGVNQWLDERGRSFGHYIDGAWTKVSGASFETRNPATGETIKIAAKKVVKFRIAKSAKDAIVPPKVKK